MLSFWGWCLFRVALTWVSLLFFHHIVGMAESSCGKMESLSKSDAQEELKCIFCAAFISPAFNHCPSCGTPQHCNKKCINSQCDAALIPGTKFCIKCAAPQDLDQFQQYLLSTDCVSCSAKLLHTGQKRCHECGAYQHTQTGRQQSPLQVGQLSSDPHTTQPSLLLVEISPSNRRNEINVRDCYVLNLIFTCTSGFVCQLNIIV